MAVHSDAVGNRFIGDAQYTNNNIGYTDKYFIKGEYIQDLLATDITELATNAGFSSFSNVANQTDIDNGDLWTNATESAPFLNFTPSGDSVSANERFSLVMGRSKSPISNAAATQAILYDDDGTTELISADLRPSTAITPNAIYALKDDSAGQSGTQLFITADSNSLGLFQIHTDYNPTTPVLTHSFIYLARLVDVNTGGSGFYSNNVKNHSVILGQTNYVDLTSFPNDNVWRHYISAADKDLLTTGDAMYPFVCTTSDIPNIEWCCELYLFDNSSGTGYPTIGRAPNLLISTSSTIEIGKPVYIIGSNTPDSGSNWWLPVMDFGTRKVLMRVHSSMSPPP